MFEHDVNKLTSVIDAIVKCVTRHLVLFIPIAIVLIRDKNTCIYIPCQKKSRKRRERDRSDRAIVPRSRRVNTDTGRDPSDIV